MDKQEALKYIEKICKAHDCKLIYLTYFGSHLYGTAGPNSDVDFKGIFVPSLESLILETAPRNISEKDEDLNLDLELYSIQEFLRHLRKGETISVDLLFSSSNQDAVIYIGAEMERLLRRPSDFIRWDDLAKSPYIRYAYSQAVKYGIKGDKFSVLMAAKEKAKEIYYRQLILDEENLNLIKLEPYIQEIVDAVDNETHCKIRYTGRDEDIKAVFICGKTHMGSITLGEFYNRLKSAIEEYGERTRLAAASGGNDWKALSHTFRALHQMIELIETGKIGFPLRAAKTIKRIKNGEYKVKIVHMMIEKRFDKLDQILTTIPRGESWNQKLANAVIKRCYRYDLEN